MVSSLSLSLVAAAAGRVFCELTNRKESLKLSVIVNQRLIFLLTCNPPTEWKSLLSISLWCNTEVRKCLSALHQRNIAGIQTEPRVFRQRPLTFHCLVLSLVLFTAYYQNCHLTSRSGCMAPIPAVKARPGQLFPSFRRRVGS